MEGFKSGVTYALVDYEGLRATPFYKGLADYIFKTGNGMTVKVADEFGHAHSLMFTDGTASIELVESFCAKFFKPVEPCAMAASLIPPKPQLKAEVGNIIEFPKKTFNATCLAA